MKIWLPSIRAGSGADVFVERLAEGLRSQDVEAVVSWFDHRYELMPWRLKAVPLPDGVNLVHANSWTAFAFHRKGVPLVVTEHHCVFDPAYAPYRSLAQRCYHECLVKRWERQSFDCADAVVTPSAFTANVLSTVMHVPDVQVIPNWVDLNRFSPAKISNREDDAAVFALLFVGNASLRKGADVLPRLAHALGDGFELRCTGGLRGGQYSSSNIVPLGHLSDEQLLNEYRQCDAFVFPSRYEGFGYAPLEAMACGRPVVAFACGALQELMQHDEQGMLVPVDDVAAMAAAIRQLRDDASLRDAMGQAARKRAEQYSASVAIKRYMDLYQSLVSKGGAA